MYSSVKQILCVEDHAASSDLICFVLKREGWNVTTANSFESGLHKVSQRPFDCYLFDQYLPDGEGTDLCRKVRASDPQVPVFIYSADARTEMRQRALDAGAAAFLTKPLDPYTLLNLIQTAVDNSHLRALDAKLEEICTIRDEISLFLDRAEASLNETKKAAGKVKKSLLWIKAYQTFLAAGGTRAEFDRMWPDVWNAEVVMKNLDFII